MFNLNRRNIYKDDGYALHSGFAISGGGLTVEPVGFTCYPKNSFNFSIDNYTVVFRIKINSFFNAITPYFFTYRNASLRHYIRQTASGTINFVWNDSAATSRSLSRTGFSLGSEQLVGVVFSKSNFVRLYVGSTFSENTANATSIPFYVNSFQVGQNQGIGGRREFDGYIRNYTVFKSALSASELFNYEYHADQNPSDVIVNYKLNQMNGSKILDSSINKNDADLIFRDKRDYIPNGNAWQPIT